MKPRILVCRSSSSVNTVCHSSWAALNGIDGAWDEKGADGIHNVFRYAFDVPRGPFAEKPLLDIGFTADGKAVIKTPKVVNTDGFVYVILAADDLSFSADHIVGIYTLDESGETVIDEMPPAIRFFRLKAVETPITHALEE